MSLLSPADEAELDMLEARIAAEQSIPPGRRSPALTADLRRSHQAWMRIIDRVTRAPER